MPTTGVQFTRHIPLDGSYNVRDVGGYPTIDSKRTRWRTLLRGDSLHRLTQAAQRQLMDLNVRTTIDLRHGAELVEAPSVFVGSQIIRYVHAPLLEDPAVPEQGTTTSVRTLAETYAYMLESRAAELVKVMTFLADPAALPALVHCTAGKDRTGMVVALALSVARVPDETIADDYALSATYLTGDYFADARLRAERRGIPWDLYRQQLVCPGPLMLETLRQLRNTFGDVEHYLVAHGMPSDAVRELRNSLVEP